MTLIKWVAVGMLTSASFVVRAQQAPETPNPTNAHSTVPAARYESAFETYRRADSEEPPSPDKNWRVANDEVAQSTGHGEHAPSQDAPSDAPAKTAPVDHSKHH